MDFKPAYLVYGDDHGRIAERRANLRALAERESGVGGVEVLEGEAATAAAIALALSAMTLAMGRRFVVVDGAERLKDAEVKEHLVAVLAALPPDTTVAFFGREEGRAKVSPDLVKAVEQAGGAVAVERTLKARELPRWLAKEAIRLGVELDADAAQALLARVGERQQRLIRELEKLAIEHGAGARLTVDDVEQATARSSERQVWGLVDALVAGDASAATRALIELQAQGESIARLAPLIAGRVRQVLAIAVRLEGGEAPAQIKASMKGSSWAADRRIADARRADPDRLRRALESLADLELATHGGSELTDGTEAVRTIAKVAG